MPSYTDALRGYALHIHRRDNWTCAYCGLDGRESFSAWLSLSVDHLLPKGHPDRDNPEYMTTSCFFCNVSDNQYFDRAHERGITFDGKTRQELIEQRRPWVTKTRFEYHSFWEDHVRRA